MPYTFHITWYGLAFLGTVFVGLTFVLLLWFVKKAQRIAERYLAMALTVGVLWVIRVIITGVNITAPTLWQLPTLALLLAFGPLIWLYVLKTTQPDQALQHKTFLHFVPVILAITFCVAINSAWFKITTLVLSLLIFISIISYLFGCHRLIKKFYHELEFTGADRHRHQLRWLHRLLVGFGLLCLLWVPLTIVAYFYHLDNTIYYPLYLLLIILLIWIAAKAFLRSDARPFADEASVLKPLLADDLKQKALWLKKEFKDKRFYEDPELSLSTLAGKLGLHTHDLSRIINTAFKKSFNDFVNEYRVQSVCRKMHDPALNHITLLGIAFESGFNSKSSFNRIFKQITGKSPVEYKNELKKEGPTYNLGRYATVANANLMLKPVTMWWPEKSNSNYMFKNYLKIAWRNLLRNKTYAAINIAGLAVGIAVCIIIFIVIQHHTSFDNFHPKKDRIYRILTDYHTETGNTYAGQDLPFPLPLGVKTAFPQIEQTAPIYASQDDQFLIPDANGTTQKIFKEQRGLFYTEPSFFEIFNFPLLAGSYASLDNPGNILLSKETAEKYFGDWKTAMGKTINVQAGGYRFSHGTEVVKVSGILASIPANSDFQLKLVASYKSFYNDYVANSTDWNATTPNFGCYILVPQNTSAANLNKQLKAYTQKVQSADNKDSHSIQPLNEVHYDTQTGNYSNKAISHDLLNVLWLISGFILLIACVNFINLSTAQAVKRSKEVGVRKVLGSNKAQLQLQFNVETFLIVIIAVLLGCLITLVSLSSVNRLLELSLPYNVFGNPLIIIFLLAITIAVTALAGLYPSVVLSRFNPVNVLKNRLSTNSADGISLRRGLVVFQFIIAQVLIIGTLVIVRQMNFFMNQPLGFDKDAIVNIPFRVDSLRISRLDYLRNKLLATNNVQAVSFSSNTPAEANNDTWNTIKFDHAQKESGFKAITKFADNGYLDTYKLKLIAGRNLQPLGYTKEFLVNEAMLKSLGIKKPEDILNKEISIWNGVIKCPVVGVVKDFNNRSFRHTVAPMLIATNNTMYTQAGLKLSTTNLPATLQSVKKIWMETFPDFVYEYRFLDEKIAGFYKQEEQLASLYKIFAAIAILLSCLGLYGLASFMAVQRVKEVGIRKVLGATAGNIVYLFSKEFIILIVIAFAVSAPIAWYYMHQWLQNYVYRINISWWLFAVGGFGALLIALTTISFQAIKAAMANPVKSLRSE